MVSAGSAGAYAGVRAGVPTNAMTTLSRSHIPGWGATVESLKDMVTSCNSKGLRLGDMVGLGDRRPFPPSHTPVAWRAH